MSDEAELFRALGDGDPERVRALLEAGADPNSRRPEDDMAPLRLAGRLCDPALVALLVEYGADVGLDGPDALLEAAVWGHLPTVRGLVEAGTTVTDPGVSAPALYEAQRGQHSQVVNYLLAAGASAALEQLPYSPLIVEAMQVDFDSEAMSRFLAEGVDPNDTARNGETALMFAAARNHETAVALLLGAGADPRRVDDWNRSAAVWAAEAHNLQLARRLADEEERAGGQATSTVTRAGARRGSRLDDLDTPLRASADREYLVLYPNGYGKEGVGRAFALGAAPDQRDALEIVSRDNTHRQTRGPYLVCRRLAGRKEPDSRPTDPLAEAAGPFRTVPGDVLVLTHTLTTPPDIGAPIANQRADIVGFRGWAVIVGVFRPDRGGEAGELADRGAARSEAVELLDVCTCREGFVEAYETLVRSALTMKAEGSYRLAFPLPEEATPTEQRHPPPPSGPSDEQQQPGGAPAAARHRRPPPLLPSEPLDPNRIIRRGFDLFRAFSLGFIGFALLFGTVVAASTVVAQALASASGLPPLPIHAALWMAGPAPLAAGFYVVVFLILGRGTPRFADFFAGYDYVVPMAVLTLALAIFFGVLLTVGAPFLIIIGVYFAVALMYAIPLVVDRDLGGLEAIATSWRIVHATFVGSLFAAIVVALTAISGVALFGVGLLGTIPMAGCMLTVAYVEAVGGRSAGSGPVR